MGWQDAAHAETDTEGRMVIAPLSCSLVEKSDNIELRANTLISRAYGRDSIEEGYHCSYGIADDFARELEQGDLRVTGWDDDGEIRAVELVTHPFFVATLFQHERNALEGRPAPLVHAFYARQVSERTPGGGRRASLALAVNLPIAPGQRAKYRHRN